MIDLGILKNAIHISKQTIVSISICVHFHPKTIVTQTYHSLCMVQAKKFVNSSYNKLCVLFALKNMVTFIIKSFCN